MHAFEYHRPSNVKDALALALKKGEGRYLAGGQSLVQAMKLRLSSPTDLIDLNAIGDLKVLKAESNKSEEHTSELQSPCNLVCRLLLEKKNQRRAKYCLKL